MAKILIVGYGNPLRSDDGLGVRAAEELSRSSLPLGTEVLACHQLTPELAERMRDVEVVLFIDAARTGRPGEIRCAQIEPRPADSLFAHRLTPATLLSLCSELYGTSPQAFEISVLGERFDLGNQLSPEVAAALPRLVAFTKDFGQSPVMTRGIPAAPHCRQE